MIQIVCDDLVSVSISLSYYTYLLLQDGNSALMEAVLVGNTEVVVELIKAGANLNLQDKVQRLSLFTTIQEI